MSESFTYESPSGTLLVVVKNPDGSAGIKVVENASTPSERSSAIVEIEPEDLASVVNWLQGRTGMPS